MYKLTYSPASPYVRKAISRLSIWFNDQIELLNSDHETHIEMKSNNPLGKIPALINQTIKYF